MNEDKDLEYAIGEFSGITRLTIKALHHYHEEGLLIPDRIDPQSGYRYYRKAGVERARLIRRLKEFDFSLSEIREIIEAENRAEIWKPLVERKVKEIRLKVKNLARMENELSVLLEDEKEFEMIQFDIIEKELPAMVVGSLRFKGRYNQIGEAFGRLFRAFGRWIAGPPMGLYHDTDYKEEDADIEAALPLKKMITAPEGLACRELPGGKALCLIHKGPYDQVGSTYQRLLDEIKKRGASSVAPGREVYLKGPGIIFKGNPQKYLTEVQILFS